MGYIQEKMATVGCGASDVTEAKRICDGLTTKERDVLDTFHNLGTGTTLLDEYQQVADKLAEQYDDDELQVLAAYVNARRNIEEY